MARMQSVGAPASERPEREVQVWDLFVRVFHWSVAIGFFVAYLTEDDALTLHVWAGYVVGGLVVLRIVWGFVGPKHARFADFVYPPGVVFAYLRDLITLGGRRYLGHSPGGGAMVIALLAALLVTVGSGLVLYAIEDDAGPLAGIITGAPARDAAPAIGEDEDERGGDARGEASGELWEEVHEVLADLTLVLVILHIAGVLLASYVHHENLTRAMVTGRKRALSAEGGRFSARKGEGR